MNQLEKLSQENQMLQEKVKQLESMIQDLSAPIISSIIPDTILVPLLGKLTDYRFNHIQSKILMGCKTGHIEHAVIDFTGITYEDLDEQDFELLSRQIEDLTKALQLMGIEALYVGFAPVFIQRMVEYGHINLKTIQAFSTFRTALQYLMAKKSLIFEQKKN
ncbi:STAS domain-containing protein [Jeotgalibacillus sp. S-D1]|uniref:STAS domain-containing protein n=1 Tax=Jeotgalibacillus sp. S-D1 TaxID=2552189 RepID=UPI00105A4DD2|nr:STAS domain-containing protein [Jeotgalibacillus sp. S-D1]TDL31847.1 STAS domain-containing protein [Jeotgalibacillus sp. S-D1]